MPLSLQNANVTLPARTGAAPGPETIVLSSMDPQGPHWRLITIGSPGAKPFNLLIEWTAAGTTSPRARLSVASGTQICVYARSVTIKGYNLHNVDNPIICGIADSGSMNTANTYEIEYQTAPAGAVLEIASFARRVRLEVSDTTAVARLDFYNGNGVLLATWPWASIPSDGVPPGGADRIVVTSDFPCRVVFDLII